MMGALGLMAFCLLGLAAIKHDAASVFAPVVAEFTAAPAVFLAEFSLFFVAAFAALVSFSVAPFAACPARACGDTHARISNRYSGLFCRSRSPAVLSAGRRRQLRAQVQARVRVFRRRLCHPRLFCPPDVFRSGQRGAWCLLCGGQQLCCGYGGCWRGRGGGGRIGGGRSGGIFGRG
jgi:hypothetical protein